MSAWRSWAGAAFSAIGLLAAYPAGLSRPQQVLARDGDALRRPGVVLFAAGGALRLRPVFVLGRRFSGLVVIQPDHQLITGGIYGAIRHPSHLALLIVTPGWALAFRSAIGILLTAAIVPPLIARIRAEEALLASELGEAYAAYRARTARPDPRLY